MYAAYSAPIVKPTLPSIGRIFDDAPPRVAQHPPTAQHASMYQRPSLTLPPLENISSWYPGRQYDFQASAVREDMYRMTPSPYMMSCERGSPDSDPGHDVLSSASSYSNSPSPYNLSPYRAGSAPLMGAYRNTPTYHHGTNHPFYAARPVSAAARHQCTYCNKRFNRPSGLKIHLTTHTGDKPYVCPEESCGRRCFSVRSNLRRHIRIVHQSTREASGEPRAPCESPSEA